MGFHTSAFACLPALKELTTMSRRGTSRGWILSCYLSPLPRQSSPYPVILSLENHCGLEQQAVMARHLRSILGDMLVTQALDSQNPEELPSPEVMFPDP